MVSVEVKKIKKIYNCGVVIEVSVDVYIEVKTENNFFVYIILPPSGALTALTSPIGVFL